ncbi:Fanconi anemia group A protein homolog [Glandiceps talaboti]
MAKRVTSDKLGIASSRNKRTFKDLLASRRHADHLSESSKGLLQEAVFQLVDHHQDINRLIKEASFGNRHQAVISDDDGVYDKANNNKETELSVAGCISALKSQSKNTGVPLHIGAANTCASKFCELLCTDTREDGKDILLSPEQQCSNLPLELLWRLHSASIMPLESFITVNLKKPNVIAKFTENLASVCELDCKENISVVKDILGVLVNYGFYDKRQPGEDDGEMSKGLQKVFIG